MAKIKDLCIRVTSGGTPTSSKGEYYDNGTIPWLRTQEVDFKKIYKTDKHITELGLSKSSAKLIPENSVIVAMYGVTAGKVAINKIPLTTNQACCNLIIDRSKADYRYIYYSIFNMYGVLSRLGTGAAQQNLNAGQIGNIEIPLPTLDRQKQIAQVLESFDDLIENNSKRIEKLEAMARLLYRQYFEVTEAGKWEIKTLSSLARVITGKTPSKARKENYSDEGMMFIKTPDMHGNLFIINTNERLSDAGVNTQKNKILPANVICLSCIGTVGVVSITSEPSQTNQQINAIKLMDENYLEYVVMKLQDSKKILENIGANGATMTNVNKTKIEKLELAIPPREIMKEFHEKVSPLFQLILNLQRKNQNLARARDLLLPRLISGEIDV